VASSPLRDSPTIRLASGNDATALRDGGAAHAER
jgi:hypothetical protein